MRESPVRPKLSRQVGSRPRGQTRQRVSEAGEGKGAGSVLSPEMGIVVVTGINFRETGGESRRFSFDGRQQSRMRYGECPGHRRGLRPGHAFTGVSRELGRAVCLPAEKGRYEDIRPQGKIPASQQRPRSCDESAKAETQTTKDGQGRVSGKDRENRATRRRSDGSLGGTYRWSESFFFQFRPGRRGSDAQATRCREGEAGHDDPMRGEPREVH